MAARSSQSAKSPLRTNSADGIDCIRQTAWISSSENDALPAGTVASVSWMSTAIDWPGVLASMLAMPELPVAPGTLMTGMSVPTPLATSVTDGAGDGVGATAGTERHHQVDRSRERLVGLDGRVARTAAGGSQGRRPRPARRREPARSFRCRMSAHLRRLLGCRRQAGGFRPLCRTARQTRNASRASQMISRDNVTPFSTKMLRLLSEAIIEVTK